MLCLLFVFVIVIPIVIDEMCLYWTNKRRICQFQLDTIFSCFKILEYRCLLGRSEKHQSQKCYNFRADYEPRHPPDIRIVFGIMIGQLSFCKIEQTGITEQGAPCPKRAFLRARIEFFLNFLGKSLTTSPS